MLGCLFLSVFFFFFFLKDNFFADERRREARVHEVTKAHQCSPTLACICLHRTFFHFLSVCFLNHHAGWQFFFLFLFFLLYSTVYATSLITNLLRRAIFTRFYWQKKKKQQKDDHGPCYSGEWKQVNIGTARFVFIIRMCFLCGSLGTE